MPPWMPMAKKYVMGPPLPAMVASQNPNLRNVNAHDHSALDFFITHFLSGGKFLLDASTFCSLFPAKTEDKPCSLTQPSNIKPIAAKGSTIPMYGTRTVLIQAAGCSFIWDFILADVKTPLLGADFLGHHGLLIDITNYRLLNMTTFRSTPLASHHWYTEICTVVSDTPYDIHCKDLPDVFHCKFLLRKPSVLLAFCLKAVIHWKIGRVISYYCSFWLSFVGDFVQGFGEVEYYGVYLIHVLESRNVMISDNKLWFALSFGSESVLCVD